MLAAITRFWPTMVCIGHQKTCLVRGYSALYLPEYVLFASSSLWLAAIVTCEGGRGVETLVYFTCELAVVMSPAMKCTVGIWKIARPLLSVHSPELECLTHRAAP